MVEMLIFIVSALSKQIVKSFVTQLIPSAISNIDIYKILISIITIELSKIKGNQKIIIIMLTPIKHLLFLFTQDAMCHSTGCNK